jgi:pilus assembly protein CpaB
MLTRTQDAEGRAVIAPLVANEMILESKLAPKEAGAGLQATIPEGMRALSVAVNDVIGVAGFVIPGTSVDVLVTGQIPGATQNGAQNVTRTILEDVRVLAAGQKIEQDRDGKPQTVPVVTLLVSPKDAATLTMASTMGKIQLVLRNTIDSKTLAPEPVLQAVVFGSGAPLSAVKPAVRQAVVHPPVVTVRPPFTVEIIIGGKRETKSFPNQ